ncbi:MAG: hypothetical protein OET90_01190 [Desulfuromonadales bacterium]|nr:hypothetical protein [Desulfuromonadales bacterium]
MLKNARKFEMVFSALLAPFFIASVVALVLWACFPDTIHSLDQYIVERYKQELDAQYQQARQSLTQGDPQETVHFLSRYESHGKGSRVSKQKRTSYQELTQYYIDNDQFGKALEYVEAWVAFDPKDLFALSTQAYILSRNQDSRELALQLITTLYEKFPEAPAVEQMYRQITMMSKIYRNQ